MSSPAESTATRHSWDEAAIEMHEQHKDAQEEKERAREVYESKLLRPKWRLMSGLYGDWDDRSLPMWLITPREHNQLLKAVQAWMYEAQM